MNSRSFTAVALLLGGAAQPLMAAGTVAFSLDSPRDGARVIPGTLIQWAISVTVTDNDNLGVAAVLVNLTQDADNPAHFNIPPATGVPVGMEGFASPAGITNPAGYRGTLSGPSGAKNRVQIGGIQNSFGAPGTAMGLDVDVDGGIGQGGSQVIATGQFAAPLAPGVYTFRLTSPVANTFDEINAAPHASLTRAATTVLQKCCITFTVLPLENQPVQKASGTPEPGP